ncbi:hypothetical protein Ancab_032020 [Ancistrocladus abbreviatus]
MFHHKYPADSLPRLLSYPHNQHMWLAAAPPRAQSGQARWRTELGWPTYQCQRPPSSAPRCDSANTKFCYFNNYSLSQPRHFCKTCRRYWTRGGALRNVPVGGGCRRNKRSKGSSSKSPATSSDRSATPSSSAASTSSMNSASVADMLGLTTQVPPLRLMPPLSSLTDYGGAGEIGLSYTGITPPVSDISFQLGSSFTLGGGGGSGGIMGGTSSFLSAPPLHFPLFAGLDATTSLYPFEGSVQEMSSFGSQLRPKLPDSGVASHQVAPVKMEENQELNLSRQFLGIQGSDQYWGGGSGGAGGSGSAWTDLSGLNSSSSTSNAL